ncbi:MAG: DUF3048 domain-containing protein [Patescibacteria group bacterium]
MRRIIARIVKFIQRKHVFFEVAAGGLLLVLALLALQSAWYSVLPIEGGVPILNEAEPNRRALDGMQVEEGLGYPPIVAVMVENMEEAQPISGLDQASVVFESVMEANITRFLAFFTLGGVDSSGKSSIGPVRSARPYFLDWVREFDALYAHVGSSPEADALIKQGAVRDLDQWFQSQYFWRDTSRPRPHNVYTSLELLKRAADKKTITETKIEAWKFKNDAALEQRGTAEAIAVGYAEPYRVVWKYDRERNAYAREQWGGPHRMTDGAALRPKNIVVAWLPMKVLDEVGRKWFGTIGSGEAVVFRDGEAIRGTWRKSAREERMRFFDDKGLEVVFNAGQMWIEIVPEGMKVEFEV